MAKVSETQDFFLCRRCVYVKRDAMPYVCEHPSISLPKQPPHTSQILTNQITVNIIDFGPFCLPPLAEKTLLRTDMYTRSTYPFFVCAHVALPHASFSFIISHEYGRESFSVGFFLLLSLCDYLLIHSTTIIPPSPKKQPAYTQIYGRIIFQVDSPHTRKISFPFPPFLPTDTTEKRRVFLAFGYPINFS